MAASRERMSRRFQRRLERVKDKHACELRMMCERECKLGQDSERLKTENDSNMTELKEEIDRLTAENLQVPILCDEIDLLRAENLHIAKLREEEINMLNAENLQVGKLQKESNILRTENLNVAKLSEEIDVLKAENLHGSQQDVDRCEVHETCQTNEMRLNSEIVDLRRELDEMKRRVKQAEEEKETWMRSAISCSKFKLYFKIMISIKQTIWLL